MLTLKEAADYVAKRLDRPAFPLSMIRSWVYTGKLPTLKVGATRFVEIAELEKFLPVRPE